MELRFYNSMTRRVEPFETLVPGKVGMYTCGPTVYNFAHIGNFRAYLFEDFTVRQGLEKMRARGYTAIPVLSREGYYVGTVSEGDFLWHILDWGDNSLRAKEKLPLRQVLRPGFNPAVRVDVAMEELLERSMRQSFIPVVDDRGAFVVIVTRQNIIRRLTTLKAEAGREGALQGAAY